MGPGGAVRSKARALRAPINPSVSKGSTEVAPSCSASALSSRPDRPRNRAARLLQRRRLQQHRSPRAGTGRLRRGGLKHGVYLVSLCTHRPGGSFRIHSEYSRCGTGVRHGSRPYLVVSEISCHSSCEPAYAIRCTGRTPCSRDVILRKDRANDACEAALVRELAAVRHPLLQQPSRARREVGRDQPPPGLGARHWPSVPQRRIARFLAVHVSPNR